MSKKALLQTCPTLPETNIFAPQKMDGWNRIVNFLLRCYFFEGRFAVSCGELYFFFCFQIHLLTQKNRWFFVVENPPTGGWCTFMPLVAACSSAKVTDSMMVLVKGTPCQKCPQLSGFQRPSSLSNLQGRWP